MAGVRRPASRGQALVEFALVFPLIVLLIFGVIDFGRAIFAYNTLAEGARQADRLAIVDQTATNVQDRAIQAMPGLATVRTDVCVAVREADTPQVDCKLANQNQDHCAGTNGEYKLGCLAFVTTTFTFRPITPVISSLVGPIALASTSVGSVEYVCPTAAKSTCP